MVPKWSWWSWIMDISSWLWAHFYIYILDGLDIIILSWLLALHPHLIHINSLDTGTIEKYYFKKKLFIFLTNLGQGHTGKVGYYILTNSWLRSLPTRLVMIFWKTLGWGHCRQDWFEIWVIVCGLQMPHESSLVATSLLGVYKKSCNVF